MKSKYILLAVVTLVTLFVLIGGEKMPSQIEIENLEVVNIVGLDKTDLGINFTALRSNISSSSEESNNPKNRTVTVEAPTYAVAVQKLKTITDKYITITHADYFLIGEDTAKESLEEVVDFLTRSYKVSLSSKLILVRGSTAKEFLEKISKEDYSLEQNLTQLFSNLISMSYTKEVTLLDVLRDFLNKDAKTVLPYIWDKAETPMGGATETKGEEDKGIDLISCTGLGVIKEMKLVASLSSEETLNYNITKGNIKYIQMIIDGKENSKVTIGINNIENNIKFKTSKDDLGNINIDKVIMNITYKCVLEEADANYNVLSDESLSQYEAKVKDNVKTGINNFAQKSKDLDIDILDVQKMFFRKHPYKYRKIKDKLWEQIRSAPIEINITGDIVNTYDINESNIFQKEK